MRKQVGLGALAATILTGPVAGAHGDKAALADYGKLPLSFEANRGQTHPAVRFLTRGPGHAFFLTSTEAVVVLAKGKQAGTALRMTFLGANPEPRVAGRDELPGKANYFSGNDPARWRTNVPTFAKVRYDDVYPGVDLIYYGNQRQLEYDLVVQPGASPDKILLGFAGAERIEVEAQGDLVLHTADGGVVRQRKPFIYQEVDGRRRPVAGGYAVEGRDRVGFKLNAYDHSRPLIIDPVLVYSTYLGGSLADEGIGIAVDGTGNAYITGQAHSFNFPTTPGALQTTGGGGFLSPDTFVTKLNASGTGLVYSTYLGGSGFERSAGIAVDTAGNAYVTGYTRSFDFPTTPGAFQTLPPFLYPDAFVTKLNPSGSGLVYSTYLGGGGAFGPTQAAGIAVDAGGHAYVTGNSGSPVFPTTPGAFKTAGSGGGDAFLTKFNPSGSGLVYSTFLGGSGDDRSCAVVTDGAGNAYVMGLTSSTNFPTTSGVFQAASGGQYDAFVTKLNPSGSGLVYSTYLGGAGNESVCGDISVDAAGNAYVTGHTVSGNFPTTPGAFQTTISILGDAFVTKLNPGASGLLYSTFLGGDSFDLGHGIVVDAGGNAHVTGRTYSTNFPTTIGAVQTTLGGTFDAFVTTLNGSGSALMYSTYLGGSAGEIGEAIAVDAAGNAYVTGSTLSTNFPITPGAFQAAKSGGSDAFIAKIGSNPTCTPTATWTATGSMASGRMAHTATLLPNGKVLIAGGRDVATSLDPVASAVLYDPATGSFSATGSMATPRFRHTATLLANGKVLVDGGVTTGVGGICIDSAELFDPAANNGVGAFAPAGSMVRFRADYTATLLPNGKVLMAGGSCSGAWTAELYDPAANNGAGGFVPTGSMAVSRVAATATPLANGKVLVAGGMDTNQGIVWASAEVFDPAANNGAGAFSSTGSMTVARHSHRSAALPGGRVLVTGGLDAGVQPLASAEVFDPGTGTFASTGAMGTARSAHTATRLQNGKVLIAAGLGPGAGSPQFLDSAELFDPAGGGGTGAFAATASLGTAREEHSATLLLDGRVLVAGGQEDVPATLASAELYSTTCVPFNTPAGTNVVVQPVDAATGQTPVTLTFSNVTQAGNTTLATSSAGPAPPANFDIGNGVYYHIETSAGFSGSVTVCIDYSGTALAGTTTQPSFGHYDAATMAWLTETVTFWDPANNIVCADVSSLSPFALLVPSNQPPVADAGPDQTIECGHRVRLDGSAAFDPDGDRLRFEWKDTAGNVVGRRRVVRLALEPGSHAFTLTVSDGNGGSASDDVTVVVRDTKAPKLRVLLLPHLLSPADHRLVPVKAFVLVRDACDPAPTLALVSIVSSEPDSGLGPGDQPDDIQDAAFGTDDRSLLLRAESAGGGRVYTVTYRARDAAGNETSVSEQVRVRPDRRR